MNLVEHQGKVLLAEAGIAVPDGAVVGEASEAAAITAALGGRVAVKAQVPAGKRGKSGAIRFADEPSEARAHAADLLHSNVNTFPVREVLVEKATPIHRELYAAVLNDPATKGPLVLFSTSGGMDIEDMANRILRLPLDIRVGLSLAEAEKLLTPTDLSAPEVRAVAETLVRLYEVYRDVDADLVEVNPLVISDESAAVALDAKVTLDPGALPRRQEKFLRWLGDEATSGGTELENEAKTLGLQYIELDGDVGVLANGAGLTMTTLDAVNHYGGRPANFLEIGGDAYTKATPALRLVLTNPNVRSLLVNFCGAFARTDVMTEGVVTAIETLRPDIPVFFTIHGTGEQEAITLLAERLGTQAYEHMDDAVRAAIAAADERRRAPEGAH